MSGCLTGMGRAKLSAVAIGVGSLVKLIAQCLLVPRFGIFGAGISVDLGFLVAFLMELRYSIVRPMRGRIHAPIGKETI
ncbi:MAG: polysaccharide biosynthesis C-terminal domain-containing protein [Christensenellaceae bacterium]